MPQQILFFEKNQCDIGNDNISATASEGADYAEYALNRNNRSAWITTGSEDANDTTWEVDLVDSRYVSDVLLIKHNFKSFKVEYWDGAAYQDFSPAINETTNADETNHYSVTQVSTTKLRITIYGTQVADEDKYLYQFIATTRIGQLAGWPVISGASHNRNKAATPMLSGKMNIQDNVGGFSCQLTVSEWKSNADLTIVETLFESFEGFLVWLCGGDEDQFSSARMGYRLEDIYLMKCRNNYEPNFVAGMYGRGLSITLDLVEVID